MEEKVEYNPQLGVRRTVFKGEYDFLMKAVSIKEEKRELCFLVETFRGKTAEVRISFPTDRSFRFRMLPGGVSGAGKNAIIDPEPCGNAFFEEKEDYWTYGNEVLSLHFRKAFWEMSVFRRGKLLTKEQIFDTNVDNRWKTLPAGWSCTRCGLPERVHETMYLFSDEAFWGFGESFTELNKRGRSLEIWQKDALSTNTEDSYKGHPFFMSSRGYAVLLNTYTRCGFDMGKTSQVSWQMHAEDGYLDYILLAGESRGYKELLQDYVKMTGQIPMIPEWAFGYWASRCTYRSRREVEEIVLRAEKEDIPLDVIHIDLWQKPGYTGAWVWDRERYPDPEGMIRWLHDRGIRLSLWNWPYLEENSVIFGELEEKGFFVKKQDGSAALFPATADSQFRSAAFDFTNPEFLLWYRRQVMPVLEMGVDVIKTDFSEAVPEDVIYFDGTTGTEGHNKQTYLYPKTIYGWMKEVKEKQGTGEPMLWGRSGYVLSHQIPAAWAGDSSSALNNHSALLRAGLGLGLSGVAFWGFDMGGFYNTSPEGDECPPTEEEYIRSMELGFFMPLSRSHGKTPREPWAFSKRALDIVRRFDKAKQDLIPYLYETALESHRKGTPMLRALLLEFPEDPVARQQDLSFMLGDALLVAPPFERGSYETWLPAGKWKNWFTGEILEGGRFVTLEPGLSELPVFQRENTTVKCRSGIVRF